MWFMLAIYSFGFLWISARNRKLKYKWSQAQWLTHVISTVWETKEGGSLEPRNSAAAGARWGNPVSTKNTKISLMWWCALVVPATWEAERWENCLNPGGGGCSEPRLCHCTPAWVTRVKLRLKKKKQFQPIARTSFHHRRHSKTVESPVSHLGHFTPVEASSDCSHSSHHIENYLGEAI